jgi:hypothetical protein
MTTDPNGWFLTSQALDHKETSQALADAMLSTGMAVLDDTDRGNLADDTAIELARAGFALVHLTPGREDRATDLGTFLSRKED